MIRRFPQQFWTVRSEARNGRSAGASGLPILTATPARTTAVGPLVPFGDVPGAVGTTLRTLHPAGPPQGLFVPEYYEPNYAYPLIVWLHGPGANETELTRVMPHVSTRNYFGLSFRGPLPAGSGFRWSLSQASLSELEDELHETIGQLRRHYHIHSERVFVAGFDEGASVALRLLLSRPEWFGGAAVLGGRLGRESVPLDPRGELRNKRVLIGVGSQAGDDLVQEAQHAGRLLHAAGLNVTTRLCDADHELTPQLLAQINHWIMDGICTAV